MPEKLKHLARGKRYIYIMYLVHRLGDLNLLYTSVLSLCKSVRINELKANNMSSKGKQISKSIFCVKFHPSDPSATKINAAPSAETL